MIHQRQGHNECALAVVAMLSGRNLEDVRREACEAAGVSTWSPVVTDEIKVFDYLRALRTVAPWWPRVAQTGATHGRGLIIIRIDFPRGPSRHAVAYDHDGAIIHDPNLDGPVSFDVWLDVLAEHYPDCWVKVVHVQETHGAITP